MEESFTWQVKSKTGFSPAMRKKIAMLLDLAGGSGGDEFPGDDLLDSQSNNLLDSTGIELDAANY